MRMFGLSRDQHHDADAYADGELRDAALERFRGHLATCERCQATVAQARTLREAVSAIPRVEAPRSFAITPEMAAAARPVRLRSATPGYLTFARAGAALSVAAFATVAAISALDSSGGDTVGTSGGDDLFEMASGQAPETMSPAYDSSAGGSPPEASPTPKLAPPTSTGGASGSGEGQVAPLVSPVASGSPAGSLPGGPVASPQPPETGRDPGSATPGPDTSRNSVDTGSALTDSSSLPLPESAAEDGGEGFSSAVVAVGALAAAAVVVLGVLEVARRRRA